MITIIWVSLLILAVWFIILLARDIIKHKLSHQHLYINFYEIEILDLLKDGISIEEAKKLPFPIVIFNFLEKYLF